MYPEFARELELESGMKVDLRGSLYVSGPGGLWILSPEGKHLGTIRGPYYLPGDGYGFALGFGVRLVDGVSPMMGTAGEANWGGITGTAFWLDPGQKLAVVFLTQAPATRCYYRPMLRAMIYGAMTR